MKMIIAPDVEILSPERLRATMKKKIVGNCGEV